MKKFLLSFIMIFTIIESMGVFAAEGDTIQITDYDDYGKVMSNEEYEAEYIKQMDEIAQNFEKYEMEDLVKTKVVKVNEPEEIYEQDDISKYIYKAKSQKIEVEVLEGEFAGEIVALTYPLMIDDLLNLEVPELKLGDIINAEIYKYNGEIIAIIRDTEASVERKAGVIVLLVITAILIVIYGKEKGLLSLLIAILIIVLALFICSEQIYLGTSIIWLTLLLAVILASMMSITKLGLTKDACLVTCLSVIIIIIAIVATFVTDFLLRNNGATFEATIMANNIIKRNIDFHELYVGSIIFMLAIILPNVIIKAWKKCKESNENEFNKLLNVSKDAMSGIIESVTVILVSLLIPKLIYLYSYVHLNIYTYQHSYKKYTMNEILNSNILVSEIVRLCMVLISIVIAVPATVYLFKGYKEILKVKNKK